MNGIHNEVMVSSLLSLLLMWSPGLQHDHGAAHVQTTVKFSHYEAELRIPDEGLFAGEEIDIEFRVTDTREKDPNEVGFKGVGAIKATAEITMPSMPGMPSASPKVHREGVPGEYGIEAFFPHGGPYKIALRLVMPDGSQHDVAFNVNVKDERGTATARLPYYLKIVGTEGWRAGQKRDLRLRVVNSKTGAVQANFDIAHEQKFHLLIASKDLNWFRHEHPVMAADGTWSLPFTFPAGGDYWIYGDVAPSGQGSRVLIAKLSVKGPKPTWSPRIATNRRAADGGLVAELFTTEAIEVGKSTVVGVRLTSQGMPAGDTVPWLGAAGHMMIFHQDGRTVVHSHPSEDAASAALVKKGTIQFSARFPKAGLYKVYVQAMWHGKVRTLGFGLRVK